MNVAFAALFKHNRWANLRLLDFCATLSDDLLQASATGTYGRAGDTLVHLFAAEQRYIKRVAGEAPEREVKESDPFPGIAVLRESAVLTGTRLIQIALDIDPDTILEGTFRGEFVKLPIMIPMMQAINHATEHRSHVSTVLSQQGIAVPELDLWSYNDEAPMDWK
jgi:uncharacterized damage-inducible protein DinB